MLKIQNKNLSERLIQRQKLESDLRDKIDQLQNRKVTDDGKLCIIDRYWTQLDEDLRLMLERFDETAESLENVTAAGKENELVASSSNEQQSKQGSSSSASGQNVKNFSHAVRNFLAKLNDWDKSELEDSLKERVKFTTQCLSKLMSNYERLDLNLSFFSPQTCRNY